MPDKNELRREDALFRLLLLLEKSPDLTQREIAQKLGVSYGALNYCLRSLIDKGFVKIEHFANSRNKFGYLYVLTPRGIARRISLTRHFLMRKMQEYDTLKSEIENLKNLSSGTDSFDINAT
jgi:EPS-associated MarR family transcriptional regulator